MKTSDNSSKKIAVLGIPGSYSFLAASHYFPKGTSFYSCKTFEEIFQKLDRNSVSTGVVPLENSLTGSIYQAYDLLLSYQVNIVGEVILKIRHCLVSKSKMTSLKNLNDCFSHEEAIKQCQNFLKNHPNIVPKFFLDTASAAQSLAFQGKITDCAIASRQAATLYNLEILARDIQDNPHNYTRFAIIGKKPNTAGNKVTIAFSVAHTPGSLFQALEPYARYGLNLTKIESRPLFGKAWEYIFFVDFELPELLKTSIEQVFGEMKEHLNFLKVLGLFAKGVIYDN